MSHASADASVADMTISIRVKMFSLPGFTPASARRADEEQREQQQQQQQQERARSKDNE